MNQLKLAQKINRRLFLGRSGLGLGTIALGSLLDREGVSARADTAGRDRRSLAAPLAGWRACRISRPRFAASFISSSRVRPRRSICSITSRLWSRSAASSCPIRSGWASGSPP